MRAKRTRVAAREAGTSALLFLCMTCGTGLTSPGQERPSPPQGYVLDLISEVDGAFEAVESSGETILRSLKGRDGVSPYLYFRLPDDARKRSGTAYLELTYKDVGIGRLAIDYDARTPDDPHR